MSNAARLCLACVLLGLGVAPAPGQGKAKGYLTDDGQLTQSLEIRDVQGGFAGFTGTHTKIEPDGKWTVGRVFRQKVEVQRSGKLTKEEVATLAGALAKYDLLGLKSEGKTTTNPHVLTVEFGKQKAVLTLGAGQQPPAPDRDNPTASVPGRFAGITAAVRDLLKDGKDDKKPDTK
jgi:hypothetical protein